MERREEFAHECRIRDLFAESFTELRSDELVIATEHRCGATSIRADLRTVDKNNVLREWEFKIRASYEAVGQILTYVAMARQRENFARTIRGVIAAFEFQPEIKDTIEIMNLGIELVSIPRWMAKAGKIPIPISNVHDVVIIPKNLPNFN
jgi:hypothetical protein